MERGKNWSAGKERCGWRERERERKRERERDRDRERERERDVGRTWGSRGTTVREKIRIVVRGSFPVISGNFWFLRVINMEMPEKWTNRVTFYDLTGLRIAYGCMKQKFTRYTSLWVWMRICECMVEANARNEASWRWTASPLSLQRQPDKNLYKLVQEKSRYSMYKWQAMTRQIRGKEIKEETEWTARWVFRYDKSRRKSSFPSSLLLLLGEVSFSVNFEILAQNRYFQQRSFINIGHGEEREAFFRARHLYEIVQPRFFVSSFRSSSVFRERASERASEREGAGESSESDGFMVDRVQIQNRPFDFGATAFAVASSCFGACRCLYPRKRLFQHRLLVVRTATIETTILPLSSVAGAWPALDDGVAECVSATSSRVKRLKKEGKEELHRMRFVSHVNMDKDR